MPGDSLQVNINSKGVHQNTYDAIVIGSGISGGWAAKELCVHGLKTLVPEWRNEARVTAWLLVPYKALKYLMP